MSELIENPLLTFVYCGSNRAICDDYSDSPRRTDQAGRMTCADQTRVA